MKMSLFKFLSRPMDTASSLGKPMLHAAADMRNLAVRQLTGGSSGQPRYRAFISYSHRDMEFARWLHRAIETYRVPRALVGTLGETGEIVPARLRPVFRDEDELAGAAELGPKLEGALTSSAALIVICSPASARSEWVDKEIRTFKALNPDRPVFGVIAAGVPGSETEECFPKSLLYELGPDGALDASAPLEPLAPDAQKMERKLVKLKLIAGLLGVPYANLYQRDLRRARKIAAGVGTFAVVLIAVLSGLSIAAVTYARQAVAERNSAVEARQLAEKNRDLAERKAWLAQTMATEYRRQSDILAKEGSAPCK